MDAVGAAAAADPIAVAVARLDAWLETMRCPGGYGGPVVHWWQQSLLYCGPGLDWRYEGIIAGYLTLWQRTGELRWLRKACRAGDDLLRGQGADGHFAASNFELNPASAGTPGEAACDVGLLLLAAALQAAAALKPAADLPEWRPYAACAERNLQAFYVDRLWDETAQAFRDDPRTPSFVPNKAATACEALFLLAEVRGDDAWVHRYALPTLAQAVGHQVQDRGPLDGAIAQNSLRGRRVEKYFPVYIARCVPALVRAARWTGDEGWAEAARRAVAFLARQVREDGSLPTVLYPGGLSNCHPSWIAPLGDVLWAAEAAREIGVDADLRAVEARLFAGQDASGGVQTARGFGALAAHRWGGVRPPEVRDVLHVAGWCDKVLRVWAGRVTGPLPEGEAPAPFEAECAFGGERVHYCETATAIEIDRGGRVAYRWRKGAAWAEVAEPGFWLR